VNLLKNKICVEQAKALASILNEHSTLKSLCGNSGEETELDMSGKGMDAGAAVMLVPEIVDNGAISSINLLRNKIPVEQAQALGNIMQAKEKLITLCGLSKEETELDFSSQNLDVGDAVLIANDISDMGAMTSLNLANNNIGTTVMSDGWQYDTNNSEYWKQIDGAEQVSKDLPEGCGPLGVIVVANAIKGMGALAKFVISSNAIKAGGTAAIAGALKGNTILTELDLSSNEMGWNDAGRKRDMSGVAALADAIPDMGALTSLNLSSNDMTAGGYDMTGSMMNPIEYTKP
jgi:hypothetical protein